MAYFGLVDLIKHIKLSEFSSSSAKSNNSPTLDISSQLSNPEKPIDRFVQSNPDSTIPPENESSEIKEPASANKNDSPKIANGTPVSKNFCEKTNQMNSERYAHTCKYMDTAQNYLGIYKTNQSSRTLTAAQKRRTQLLFTNQFQLQDNEPWCAAAVTKILLEAGIKDLPGIVDGKIVDTNKRPTDRACVNVSGYVDWGDKKNIYHRWSKESGASEQAKKKAQLSKMHQGDLVIWKDNGNSHIGFIEFVDIETGNITFMAGNNSDADGKQKGVVRKKFNIYISKGYSGFIDMTMLNNNFRY